MHNKFGTLYIVSTPIGNLNDITNRAIEILNKVEVCAAEDTRKSINLFNAHSIKTKLTSYHKFSEKTKTKSLIKKLLDGKDIAIISDAGTPLISDPGRYLVNAAIEAGIEIVPIPGVSFQRRLHNGPLKLKKNVDIKKFQVPAPRITFQANI